MEMSARKPLLPRRVLDLPIDALRPNPNQPRIEFDEASLRSLSDSIRRYGILQPLTVRRTDEGYELIAGERRLRAAKIAGLREVPCLLARSSEEESALLALIENLQRRDLHYLEEAAAIARLIATYGLSQEQAAERLGKSQSAIANKLRLLRLSPDCVRLLREHDLSERHARALLRLTDEEDRLKALQVIAARGYNVAQSEAYIEELLKLKPENAPAAPADLHRQGCAHLFEHHPPLARPDAARGRRGRHAARGHGRWHPFDYPHPETCKRGRIIP